MNSRSLEPNHRRRRLAPDVVVEMPPHQHEEDHRDVPQQRQSVMDDGPQVDEPEIVTGKVLEQDRWVWAIIVVFLDCIRC